MIKSQSEKCLAQSESNISVGVHVGSSLIKVKDTHLMNNNQPVAEILCWRLVINAALNAIEGQAEFDRATHGGISLLKAAWKVIKSVVPSK